MTSEHDPLDALQAADEALLWQWAVLSFDRTIETIEELRQRLCAYGPHAVTCDCKYANLGTHGRPLGGDGETTGCPELREAIEALRLRPQIRALMGDRAALLARLRAAEAERDELRALRAENERLLGKAWDDAKDGTTLRTVGELRAALSEYGDDTPIAVHDGWTWPFWVEDADGLAIFVAHSDAVGCVNLEAVEHMDEELRAVTYIDEVYGGKGDFNLIASVGPEATQTVWHYHLHIVPRRPGDRLALPWSEAHDAPA